MDQRALRVLVIGAGAGGIAAGVRMLEDGHDVLVADRADGIGGVWRANSYPGARCDVPSHLYSLSFHPKHDWTRRYAGQAQILAYLEDAAQQHGLTPHLALRTEVTECAWQHDEQLWRVVLCGPDGLTVTREFDVVIAACGQLSQPAVPNLPGLEDFSGPSFHSAQWRHDIDLTGKRVAVVGTGASAVQFVPEIAGTAAQVTVFQRSAPYFNPKRNRYYGRLEQGLYDRFPKLLAASRLRQYLWHESLGLPFTTVPALMALPTAAWRIKLHRQVRDPELRARLIPGYTMGCKRVLRATDWYPTIVRPDVDLVTEGIDRVTANGIETADGVTHEADVIIFGTGFEATHFLTPMRITGRDGAELGERWRDGASAYLGTVISGFPNLFLVYGPGTNLGHNSIIFMIESQIALIRSAVSALSERWLGWVDVRPEVESEYDARFRRASSRSVWETGCSSWYTVDGRNTNNWPGSTLGFRYRTRRLDLADVEIGQLSPSRLEPLVPAPVRAGGLADRALVEPGGDLVDLPVEPGAVEVPGREA